MSSLLDPETGALAKEPPASPREDLGPALSRAIAAETAREGTSGGTEGGTDPGPRGDGGGTARDGEGTRDLTHELARVDEVGYPDMIRCGETIFSAEDLALISTLRKNLPPAKRKTRKKLLDRASEWRSQEKDRIRAECDRRLAAAAERRGEEVRVGAAAALTGAEPYIWANRLLEVAEALEVLEPLPEFRFAEDEIATLRAPTARVLAGHPAWADYLVSGGPSPEGMLLVTLLWIESKKWRAYRDRKAKEAAAAGPPKSAA